jgi:hypothetical protein
VVAWLRERASRCGETAREGFTLNMGQEYSDAFEEEADDLRDIADTIERGAHIPPATESEADRE